MPNLRIFVDESAYPALRDGLSAPLPRLRDELSALFAVEPPACQLAVIPVLGLPGQPLLNVELDILSRPERTRDAVNAAAARLRGTVSAATGQRAAVRVTLLDPEGYVALR